MKAQWLCFIGFFLVSSGTAYGHSEHDKPRFVAADGRDTGNCEDRFRPCKTLGYAASRSNKGDRVLVASGSYPIGTADELFYLTSGIVRIEGGFSQRNYYNTRDTEQNPTTLVGVPSEFRNLLSSQGFRVIADRKALSAEQFATAKQQLAHYKHSQESQAASDCVGGQADGFACNRVDLVSHIALGDLSSSPTRAADIWGFIDLNTGREYALMGLRNGTTVIDVTETDAEFEVGTVSGANTTWRDIKVYQFFDTAAGRWQAFGYVTTDSASDRLTVIDLRGLPNSIALSGRETADSSAHNVTIGNANYATGTALSPTSPPTLYVGGSNLDQGAFRAFELSNPQTPGLNARSVFGGYMHDGVAFTLDDARAAASCGGLASCEILVDFNEGEFAISRLNGGSATLLSSQSYSQASYVHSGWLSEDQQFLFVHDELDEQDFGLNTTVRVFDLTNLAAPTLVRTWTGPTGAIDHNGYSRGNRYYMSNYTRGLTVLDITDPSNPAEVGFFDSFPSSNNNSFNGAWGVYPYLPSGKVLVSDINSGLYVLRDATLSLGDGSVAFSSTGFGSSEGTQVQVAVERQGGTGAGSVGYRVIPGSASAVDYTGASGRLSWPAGQTGSQNIAIDLLVDGTAEPVEQFFVELFDPQGGMTLASPAFAQVFIADQAGASEVGFLEPTVSVPEDGERVLLTVQRGQSVSGSLQVDYQTTAGSASAGGDFVAANGSLQWGDGDGSPRSFVVALTNDSDSENDESFTVDLTISQGNAVLAATGNATVTITDADAPPPPPPPPAPPPTASGGGGGGALVWLLLLMLPFVRRSP